MKPENRSGGEDTVDGVREEVEEADVCRLCLATELINGCSVNNPLSFITFPPAPNADLYRTWTHTHTHTPARARIV